MLNEQGNMQGHRALIGWLWFLLVGLMRLTGCPAHKPVNTSSDKRCHYQRKGKLFQLIKKKKIMMCMD